MHEKFRGLDRGAPTKSSVHFSSHHIDGIAELCFCIVLTNEISSPDEVIVQIRFKTAVSHQKSGIAVFGKGSNNNLLVPNVTGAVHTPKYAVHRLAPAVEGCNKRNVNDGDECHKPASYHGQREPLKDSFDHVGTIPP